MTKKIDQFLRHWIIGGRIILWLSIGPSSFPYRYSFCGWAGRNTSLWFCFSLWSARKSTCIRFQRIVFELHLLGFQLAVVPLFVVQVCEQLIQAMRNSAPRERMVLFQRLNSDFHSIFNLVGNWLQLPIWVQSQCSPESNLLVQIFLHLLAVCTHDKPLNLWIVRILQCLSSWNTVRLQLLSGILHQYKIYSLYLVVIIFQFVPDILAIDLINVQDHW